MEWTTEVKQARQQTQQKVAPINERTDRGQGRRGGRPQSWSKEARGGIVIVVAVAAILHVSFAPPAAAYPRPGVTERVSVASDGSEANADSGSPSVSADGRSIAWHSSATNLVSGDTNQRADVFVHDVPTGTTERVSVASDGIEGNAGSLNASVSGDGRYVAFASAASNLVPGDGNGTWDIFVRDRRSASTERLSVATGGGEGNGASQAPSISSDGRYVAFYSDASNLVPEDTNGAPDSFVHDRATGTTERVSVASDGSQGTGHPGSLFSGTANGGSYLPSISPDGRHVCFWSSADNLVAGDTNQSSDVFVHDRETGDTERRSVASAGSEGNGHSYNCSVSTGGTFVAFESWASNFVPEDTNNISDIFVHDRETGTTERISIASDGTEAAVPSGAFGSGSPSISADGRHVAFYSLSSTLVPGKTRANPDVFVRDREAGVTERVSVAPGGVEADGNSTSPSMSPDGRYLAFESSATNLVRGIGNGAWDAFVFDRGPSVGAADLAVVHEEDRMSASGWARLSGAVVASATDPHGDVVAGADAAGGDLTGASITLRPEEEDLLVGLGLASLPGEAAQHCVRLPTFPPVAVCDARSSGAGAPAVVYGVRFEVGDSSYEIRALRTGATAVPPEEGQYFGLYECAPVCIETARLAGGIGTTGPEMLVSVPLDVLGVKEDAGIAEIQAFTGVGEAAAGVAAALDELQLPDAALPEARVELGVAPATVAEEDVTYTASADLIEGAFSGTVDASSLAPGDYRLWARACLGTTCGARSAPVTIAGNVLDTLLHLETERVRGTTVATATLVESDRGAPIAGAGISFFVNDVFAGDAVTDDAGQARITLRRNEFKAHDVLRALFAGDDNHAPSTAERTAGD